MTPTVSVVTSVYNGAKRLGQSVESILSQTGVDFELIIIDDGSTDGTPSILDEFRDRDQQIRVIRQDNRGLTRVVDPRLTAEARGKFIARHDLDDTSLCGRFAQQVALIEGNSQYSMVSCWGKALGPQEEILREIRRPESADSATALLVHDRQGPPGHGSVMFRRASYEAVGGYRPEFYCAQDIDLWLRLAEIGQIAYVPQFLYAYRIDEASISSRLKPLQQRRLGELVYECSSARRLGRPEAALLAEALSLRPNRFAGTPRDTVAAAYFIGSCLAQRNDVRARGYLRKVLAQRPWMLRAWMKLALSYWRSDN